MKIPNVKTDLHTHGWCGQEEGFGQIVMTLFGERGKRNLQTLAGRGFREKQDTLIGFVNFDDTRYQKIVNTRHDLPKNYDLYDEHVKRFVGVYNKEKELWNFILRGQEIPTDKGHLLILGNDKEIERRTIEDVLKEADDINALIVGDHILGLKGLGENNVREYRQKLNMIEYGNSNYPWDLQEARKLGEGLSIPGLYNSDSHDLNRMFSSHMIFPELDFSNWENLREEIVNSVKDERTTFHAGRNRILEIPIHLAAVYYNVARQKAGIVKMPEYEIE